MSFPPTPVHLIHLLLSQPAIETATKMKQFLQTVAVFSALVAAKPLRNFRSRGCNDTWTVGQTVNTTSGPIQGHAASEALEVSEYLGIPFAQPPTGSLRFQPPVAFNGSSIINGTDFVSPPSCILQVIPIYLPLPQRLLPLYHVTNQHHG